MITGTVKAIVATFGEINRNGKLLLPGSIDEGRMVFLSHFDHAVLQGDEAVGTGFVHTVGRHLILTGRFHVFTPRGKDAFTRVDVMGDRIRWSLGFDILESTEEDRDGKAVTVISKAQPYEASPVHRPADPNARTLYLSGRREMAGIPA